MLGQVGWRLTLRAAIPIAVLTLAALGAGTARAGWLPVANLAPPSSVAGGPATVAVAPDGTAFAAFEHFDGAKTRAAVATRGPGGGFGALRDLSDAGVDSFAPVVAVDRQGNATVAWTGPGPIIQARYRPAGGDWGSTQTISGTGGSSPALGAGDNGAAVVVWKRNFAVEAAIRPAGQTAFAGGSQISPAPANGSLSVCGVPGVAMDPAGDVAVIWTRRQDVPSGSATNFHYLVETSVKPAGDLFQPAEPRSPDTTGNSPCHTDIAITPGGRVLAIWDFGPPGTFVQYADRTGPSFAAGSWSVAAMASPPGATAGTPQIGLDGAGNATATWLAGSQVVSSSIREGLGAFSNPKPLSGPGAADEQAIGASSSGHALILFSAMLGGDNALFGASRPPGGDFGGVTPITSGPASGGKLTFFRFPDVAHDDQGNAFAVWNRDDNGPGDVFTSQVAGYDPVPPSITSAGVPTSGTAGQAIGMSAAATDRMSGANLHFDYGDGSGGDGGSVSHTYAAAGNYVVTIVATDGAGNQSNTTRNIQITPAGAAPGGPTAPGGQTPGGGTSAAKKIVAAVTALSWDRLSNGRTRMRSLIIDRLDGPEVVKISCKGKGCRKSANRTIRKHGRRLSLTKYVAGMTLQPKARLTITVSRPGYVTRIFNYTMINRRDPRKSTRCLAPGQKKSSAC